MMVTITAVGVWYYISLTDSLPSIETLPALIESPNGTLLQPSIMYDRTHEHVILTLQNPAAEDRQYLRVVEDEPGLGQVSQNLIDATITAFDPGYWQEPAFTLSGILEDSLSTLAQRLVSSLLLDDEPASLKRNLQVRLLAGQMVAQFGREKVLEWYLNSAQYGGFVYGADAAARVYLGKPATQLTIGEAAMLTAIAESPSINPWTSRQGLRDRQVEVIQGMLANRLISEAQAQAALKENIQFQTQRYIHSQAPELTNLVLWQLSSEIPLERVYRGGYEIITSLDYDLQLQASCTSQVQQARIQGRQAQLVTEIGTPCEASQWLPTLATDGNKSIEGIRVSIIVLDPQVGEILAWIGGDASDPAPRLPAEHPAGMILSPFLYLTAFSQGMSPATLLWDLPQADTPDISLETLVSYHGPVRLRSAFINDYQGAMAEAIGQVGLENIWQTESSFGINMDQSGPSIATTPGDLSSQSVSLLDSLQAYGVLANQGVMAGRVINEDNSKHGRDGLFSTSVLRVEGMNGQVWLDWSDAQVQPIVSDQLAYLTTDVLADQKARAGNQVIPGGLGIGRPVGVKVSVTPDNENAWAVGYIPQLAVGVWIGSSKGELTTGMTSALWQAVMGYASKPLPVMEFTVPEGISREEVCDPSGMLPSPICPSTVEEIFLQGSEPTQVDNLYQELLINTETGLLATIFTPTELVEKKLFLMMPPKAIAWAKAAGVPIPPDTYDDILTPPITSDEVNFSQPKMSKHVKGQIEIYGSASGIDFSYYRLQVGQGLFPQEWIQIGEDTHQPVQDGLLGTWDTAGLEGAYIIELLVVSQNMRVDRSLLQVSIDNTAPQVIILTPKENAHVTGLAGKPIIIQASVTDNLALGRVEFYMDGALMVALYESPFILLWPAQPGAHNMLVKAYDLAGNQNQAEISFTVSK